MVGRVETGAGTNGLLYSFRRCPYAMRARMALAQSGHNPEHREIVLRNKPAHMLELGERGTVPLLVLEDGTVFEHSVEIMDWALAQHDPASWLRNRQDPTLCDLLEQNDGPFKADLDRYKYPDRFPDEDPAHLAGARDRAMVHLRAIEAQLGPSEYLDGASPGFFDAAIFPFVRQFSAVDRPWFQALPLGALVQWRARMLEHPGFTSVMKKVPVWSEGDAPTAFVSTLR